VNYEEVSLCYFIKILAQVVESKLTPANCRHVILINCLAIVYCGGDVVDLRD